MQVIDDAAALGELAAFASRIIDPAPERISGDGLDLHGWLAVPVEGNPPARDEVPVDALYARLIAEAAGPLTGVAFFSTPTGTPENYGRTIQAAQAPATERGLADLSWSLVVYAWWLTDAERRFLLLSTTWNFMDLPRAGGGLATRSGFPRQLTTGFRRSTSNSTRMIAARCSRFTTLSIRSTHTRLT